MSRRWKNLTAPRGRWLTLPPAPPVPAPPFIPDLTRAQRRKHPALIRRGGISLVLPPAPAAAPGTILLAAVGTDGWYLDVTIAGISAGGTYNPGLGPNNDPAAGAPTLTLTATSLGFTRTGAPTVVTRIINGTAQVRQPYPNQLTNQETTENGNITIRVALSDYVFAKDNTGTGNSGIPVTASFAAGLYTSGGTPSLPAVNIPVVNNSAMAYPKVTGNWVWPGYDKTGATFPLRAVAYHASASQGQPVQCVIFTAADQHAGVNTTTVTAPSVDPALGDDTPVVEYIATMDASGLTQGDTITCNFVAYPAVGDTAACLDTTQGSVQPTPLYGPTAMICDKSSTYATSVAVVDSVGGNDSTGAVTGNFSLASPPAAYLTMATAFTALQSYNNTNYGRNNCGGSTMYLRDGTHNWVNGTVTMGSAPDTWLTIAKYPTSSRGNVIIGPQSGGQSLGLKVKLQDLLLTGQNAFGTISAGPGSWLWVDRCEINAPVANQPLFYINTVVYVTRSLITNLNTGFRPFTTDKESFSLIRGNTAVVLTNGTIAYTMLGNTIPASSNTTDSYIGQTIPSPANTVIACNRFSGAIGGNATVSLRMGTTTETHGVAFVQNLVEITTSSIQPAVQISADGSTGTPVNNVLIWNNVIVGQRINLGYNDTGTAPAVRLGWSVKNNIFDAPHVKSDSFNNPTDHQSGGRIGNWSHLYGCGASGNMYANTAGIGVAGVFVWDFPGVKTFQPATTGEPANCTPTAAGFIQFINRQSYNGTTSGSGGGDYHVMGMSPAALLQRDLVIPYDLAGIPRSAADSAGTLALATLIPALIRRSISWSRTAITLRRSQGGALTPKSALTLIPRPPDRLMGRTHPRIPLRRVRRWFSVPPTSVITIPGAQVAQRITVSTTAVALNTLSASGSRLSVTNTSMTATCDLGEITVIPGGGYPIGPGDTVTVVIHAGDVLYAARSGAQDAVLAVLRT